MKNKLRIKLVSDLHLEFSTIVIPNDQNYDVLILSGDILISQYLHDYTYEESDSQYANIAREFRSFLTQVSNDFPKVIYVAGNHELYHGGFHKGIQYLYDECANYPNIFFLEKDFCVIDNVAFIGATLWTDCNSNNPLSSHIVQGGLNDYRLIRNDKDGYRKIRTMDTIARHYETILYFAKKIEQLKCADVGIDKFVIVGHHSPSFLSLSEKYPQKSEINYGYHNNLEPFILDHPEIVLWTHGHSHCPMDYYIGTTRVVCNPRGYEGDSYNENTGWNPNILIEI